MLKLGVVVKNGEIRNHRSLLKIVANPFLRLVGLQFVTVVGNVPSWTWRVRLGRCPRQPNLLKNLAASWMYRLPDGAEVQKKRRVL